MSVYVFEILYLIRKKKKKKKSILMNWGRLSHNYSWYFVPEKMMSCACLNAKQEPYSVLQMLN